MGRSAEGILFYGVQLDVDQLQPWQDDKFEDCEEAWWRSVNGFVNPVECPYDDAGEYKPGYSENDSRVGQYFDAQIAWKKANPMPFEVLRIGYSEEPTYVLAVPGAIEKAEWDECREITSSLLSVMSGKREIVDFCDKYGIHRTSDPGWYLTSYYG